MKWTWEFGPASVLTALGIIIQAGVVVWVVSAGYTGVTNQFVQQGNKIEEVAKGSDKRFETVYSAIKETRANQADSIARVTRLETAIAFISDQVSRVEARLNGPVIKSP